MTLPNRMARSILIQLWILNNFPPENVASESGKTDLGECMDGHHAGALLQRHRAEAESCTGQRREAVKIFHHRHLARPDQASLVRRAADRKIHADNANARTSKAENQMLCEERSRLPIRSGVPILIPPRLNQQGGSPNLRVMKGDADFMPYRSDGPQHHCAKGCI